MSIERKRAYEKAKPVITDADLNSLADFIRQSWSCSTGTGSKTLCPENYFEETFGALSITDSKYDAKGKRK
jgi:hypothetical protein